MKNSIKSDFIQFIDENKTEHLFGASTEDLMQFATLVEARINNNLTLINNPELCDLSRIDKRDLLKELRTLFEIRQKISFAYTPKDKARTLKK